MSGLTERERMIAHESFADLEKTLAGFAATEDERTAAEMALTIVMNPFITTCFAAAKLSKCDLRRVTQIAALILVHAVATEAKL